MTTPPCHEDPEAFNLDPDHPETHRPVHELIAACMGCPLLRECRAQFEADPHERYGVIAALYRPHPVDGAPGYHISQPRWNVLMQWLYEFIDTAPAGTQLPSGRELSRLTGVNHAACTLALKEVMNQGLISEPSGRGHIRVVLPLTTAEHTLATSA